MNGRDDSIREHQVALAKCTGRKEDVGPSDLLSNGRRPREGLPMGSEDGVGAGRIAVPPEAVKLAAQRVRQPKRELCQAGGVVAVRDEDDLCALTRAFDGDLYAAKIAHMGPVSVGTNSGLFDGRFQLCADSIDEGVVDETAWHVDDAVASLLEDPDLWRRGSASDREPRPIPKAKRLACLDREIVEPGGACGGAKRGLSFGRDSLFSVARASGAGRSVSAVFGSQGLSSWLIWGAGSESRAAGRRSPDCCSRRLASLPPSVVAS